MLSLVSNGTYLENLYEVNGLTDYRLKTTEDLLRVHSIDCTKVAGYEGLDDINKAIYKKFIVNFFNAWGFDNRLSLVPKGIYWVEDTEYIVKERSENNYYNIAGQTIYTIDRTGNKKMLHEWNDGYYKHLERIADKPKYYLYFEYQHGTDDEGNPINKWLHVIKEGSEWY